VLYRLLSRLPLPVLHALAWPGYLFLYYVAGYRKAVVKQNISQAFPGKSAREVTELAKNFYRQLVEVALEILHTRHMSATEIRRRVRLVNPQLVEHYSAGRTRPVIVLAIHQGNWEWMMHGVSLALDIPVTPVYKPLHNKPLDRLMYEIRSRFGSRPLAMAEASRDILRHRRDVRLIALVADQAPIPGERSYWTRFLNREAAFYLGGASIARAAGYPVLFAQCRRSAPGYYEVTMREVAQPPHDPDDSRIIERYARLAEQAIRAEPESWLWSNRRWKRQPPDGL
jgi:KDO2-lipid IV(A) lauroyltransferase